MCPSMSYHRIVLFLLQPLCEADHNGLPTPPGSPIDESLIQIRDASARHMETLIRLYYLRHGFDNFFSYLAYCLVFLGFKALEQLRSLQLARAPALTNSTNTNGNLTMEEPK